MRRVAPVGAIALVFCLVLESKAIAAPIGTDRPPEGPKPTGEVVGNTPSVSIAYDGGGAEFARRTYRSGGSGPTWHCIYYATNGVAGTVLDISIDTSTAITPEVDQTVALTCSVGGEQVYQQILNFDPAMPFGLINPAGDAALLARELLPLPDPDIVTSPPVGRPQLAGVATWFRVGDAWQTFSATATLAGVSATVTATPTTVVWEPGDGSPSITCTGPGDEYDPGDPAAVSDCAHTYVDATPSGGGISLTATITYEVAWTATDGSADTLDPVTRTSTVAVTVDEVQALVR